MIQEGLDEHWPEEARRAARSFRQGHLIETPPFFYAADTDHGVWRPTRDSAGIGSEPDGDGIELVELHPEDRPKYGIVTSQTCDVAEDRPDPVHPWIQLAPVYPCAPGAKLRDCDYICELEPPDVGKDILVADLRVEVPIEKSALVAKTPIEAFSDEVGYEEFAEILAYRRGRPALHSVFHEMLSVTTKAMKDEGNAMRTKARRVRHEIYKLKLRIQDGSRLEPKSARLYVVTRSEPSKELRDWLDEWWDRAREIANARGLELLPLSWLETNDLAVDLEEYERLIDVRNPI